MVESDVGEEDTPWAGVRFDWKAQATWLSPLTNWLQPYLRKGALQRLARTPREHLYLDDPGWVDRVVAAVAIDEEELVEFLADDLMAASLRAYHACRVLDAGRIHREGLKVNDPNVLADEARQIVANDEELAWLRTGLEEKIATFDHRERDTNRLYVVADERPFLEWSGHYLLYGSEWIQVLLGWGAHEALRRRGSPTIIELDLPLNVVHSGDRTELARVLLREWGRQQVADDGQSPEIDFSFILRRNVPPVWITGHSHPARIRNPFHRTVRQNPFTDCPSCRADDG